MLEAEAAFRQLVGDVAVDPPLDEGALLIAAVGTGADVEAGLSRLDELAAAALELPDARSPAGLARVLFVDWAFAGNAADYSDPRNSFLPDVIERRLGLPITLSVLLIEIGRRLGVALHGVGMPGHFIVGITDEPGRFIDPFHAGAVIDPDGARLLFAATQGTDAGFRDELLAPTSARGVLLRMLANLRQTYAARRSAQARWVARLQLAFPELPAGERSRTADVLASVGAFDDAARVLTDLAARTPDDTTRASYEQRAVAHRSRSN